MLAARISALLVLSAAFGGTALAADVPDFSGMWGRNAFNFEPIDGAPQPVMNLSRMPDGSSNIGQLVGDYKNPIQVRRVRLNASHPAKIVPSPMGDSVGHYEGDTLVVDTVGIQPNAYAMVDRYGAPVTKSLHVVERYRLIDGVQAKQAQDRYEKIDGRLGGAPGVRLIDPDISRKGLQVHVTVEDPSLYTSPWSGYVTYRQTSAEMPWEEHVCAENPNEYYAGRWVGLPKADKPDF